MLFHGRGGDLIILEQVDIDQGNGHNGKNQGVEPFHHDAVFPVSFFPEGPVHLSGDIHIKNDGYTQQEPVIPKPDDKKHIEQGDNPEPEVLIP